MWKPKDPRARAVIKLTVWSGLLVWMVFLLAFGVVAAQRLGIAGPLLFGTDIRGQIMTWAAPIWVVFTTLMLIWAVARFAVRRMPNKGDKGDN